MSRPNGNGSNFGSPKSGEFHSSHAAKTMAFDGRRYWRVTPPAIEAQNPIGSGDAFTAGLVSRLLRGDDLGDLLHLTAKTGAGERGGLEYHQLTRDQHRPIAGGGGGRAMRAVHQHRLEDLAIGIGQRIDVGEMESELEEVATTVNGAFGEVGEPPGGPSTTPSATPRGITGGCR